VGFNRSLLSLAMVIPLAGWLSERFGSKGVWMIAVAVFAVGSALCGTAWPAGSLIFLRVLQGLGGGLSPPIAWGPIAAGGLLISLFMRHALRARRPLIDMHLFRSAGFSGATPVALVPASVLFATQRRDRQAMTARRAAGREVTAVGRSVHSQPTGWAATLSP
jgi:MFS family permease